MTQLLITKRQLKLSVISNLKISSSLSAFTLIEVLVAIAIMGMLLALLVPIVDRSLSKNRLASDVEIFRSKLEEVRLLAGSTQQNDEGSTSEHPTYDETGYYALFVPGRRGDDYFAVVRLSEPISGVTGNPDNYCSAEEAVKHADPTISVDDRYCLIERVKFSRGVKLINNGQQDHLVAFKVPSRQLNDLMFGGNLWQVTDTPVFNWSIRLTFASKTAKVELEPYTARVKVTYFSNNTQSIGQ